MPRQDRPGDRRNLETPFGVEAMVVDEGNWPDPGRVAPEMVPGQVDPLEEGARQAGGQPSVDLRQGCQSGRLDGRGRDRHEVDVAAGRPEVVQGDRSDQV